jgi:hypothetical protein
MKIEELRIGNLVSYQGKYLVLTVQDFLFFFEKDICPEPVDLTDELLLKTGFVNLDTRYHEYGKSFNLWFCRYIKIVVFEKNKVFYLKTGVEPPNDIGEDYGYPKSFVKPIKHVHKLQNLYFDLTDEMLVFNTL